MFTTALALLFLVKKVSFSILALGSWENYDVFGNIEAVTSGDYKNTAYFHLKVKYWR